MATAAPTTPSPTSGCEARRATRRWLAAGLFFGTALLYAQTAGHPFVYFDDTRYLTENPVVQGGLSWRGLGWAFTTFNVSNWHPLTWLSHMLDVELFGLRPGAHHLENALWHGANAALLFLVLRRMTGSVGRSAAVALLFAVHPLRVESVAWASERKDVLSTFFGLLAIWAYVGWVERPALRRRLWVLLWFALSLLAKPMWVTLPALLLLLDFWPLGRLAGRQGALPSRFEAHRVSSLLLEKVPLLLMSLGSAVVTVLAQHRGGAVTGLEVGIGARLGNAALACAAYLGKTFWPGPLAVYYPHPGAHLPLLEVAAACTLFAGLTALALWQARRRPWFAVGWLWFAGTLVPVIGLVQVGSQGMADRYTYLPGIGVVLALVWGLDELAGGWLAGRAVKAGLAVATLVLCALTWRQEGYWASHELLFTHALAVAPESGVVHAALSEGYRHSGQLEQALFHAREAVRVEPYTAKHRNNVAMLDLEQQQVSAAREELLQAVRLDGSYALAWSNLGEVDLRLGLLDEAGNALEQATRLAPTDAQAWGRLGRLYVTSGRPQEALGAYRQAVALDPGASSAWTDLGILCQAAGMEAEAGEAFQAVTRLQPRNAIAWRNLGIFRVKSGQLRGAAEAYRQALQLRPQDPELEQRLRSVEATLGR